MWLQLAPGDWAGENRVAAAVIRPEPAELRERFNLQFSDDEDQLGPYEGSLIELSSGARVGLIRWVEWSEPGTALFVAEDADVGEVVTELVAEVGLVPDDVTWRRGEDWSGDAETTA